MREIHPISGACVWHGRKMATSPPWRRRLGDAQLAEIDRAVRRASARGLDWQTMTANDFPLPSCAALAEDIRSELEDGSGIVLLQGLDPSPYRLDELSRAAGRHVCLFQPRWRGHARDPRRRPRRRAAGGAALRRAAGIGGYVPVVLRPHPLKWPAALPHRPLRRRCAVLRP